jgi:type IV pilus assembly protein PilE
MNNARMRGLTLVELLTVMTVLGILASLAVSSYSRYGLRAQRTDGTTALLRLQVAEEKFFLSNNTYTTDFTSAPPTGLGISNTTNTNGGRYSLSIAAGATGAIATSYLATATAIGGQLSDDSACQTYTVNEQGARTPADSTGCWK